MRKSALLAATVAVVLVVPIAVYASHQFDDVPASHTFHNAIAWMADNGITVGCNADGDVFCPDDFVTRAQMSAFMKRLAEKQVVDAASAVNADRLGGYGHAQFVGSQIRVRSEVTTVPAIGSTGTISSCEAGEILVGGGAGVIPFSADLKISGPWPRDDGDIPTGWQASASGGGMSEADLEVYALCASYPVDG